VSNEVQDFNGTPYIAKRSEDVRNLFEGLVQSKIGNPTESSREQLSDV
jgi:hypothetical protein